MSDRIKLLVVQPRPDAAFAVLKAYAVSWTGPLRSRLPYFQYRFHGEPVAVIRTGLLAEEGLTWALGWSREARDALTAAFALARAA